MPLENATYISDLVTTNPATSDGMNGADDHMRLTKAVIKNTFPNLTGAVTATQADINSLVSGVSKINDAGVFFATSGDGFKNSLAGDIDVWLGGQIGATFQRTGGANFLKVKGALTVDATITSTGNLTAPGMMPVASIIIWPSNTLPPASEGTWYWCNGAYFTRTAYPDLFSRISTLHGNGDGTGNTFSIPNYQEVVLIGKSGMGGATAPGFLTTVATGIKDILSALFGSETHTLTSSQMPAHYHSASISDPGHSHGVNQSNVYGSDASYGGGVGGGGSFGHVGVGSITVVGNATGVRVNSSNGLDTTYSTGGGAAHNNIQPSRAVNYIIRLA